MPTPTATRRIALLVDLDNAQIAAGKEAFDHCAHSLVWPAALVRLVEEQLRGRVDIRLVFGDAMRTARRVFRDKVWKPQDVRARIQLDSLIQDAWCAHGFRFVHTPPVTSSLKNGADIQMCLDAIQLANSAPHIDTFAVLSADSDFSSLNARLRRLDREVAVVTVGRPDHRGMAALLAHGNAHVVYDQAAVDACGPAALRRVIDDLDDDSLANGIRVNVLMARLREIAPDASHEDLGFPSAVAMLEACLDEDFSVQKGMVRRRRPQKPTPTPAVELSPDDAAATALRKAGVRPRPATLLDLRDWLSTNDDATQGAAIDALMHDGHSKSAIRDCWRLLVQSGAARLDDADDDVPTFDRAMLGLSDDADTRMVLFAVSRLEAEGRNLNQDEVARVASALLGPARVSADLLSSVHELADAVAAASK